MIWPVELPPSDGVGAGAGACLVVDCLLVVGFVSVVVGFVSVVGLVLVVLVAVVGDAFDVAEVVVGVAEVDGFSLVDDAVVTTGVGSG